MKLNLRELEELYKPTERQLEYIEIIQRYAPENFSGTTKDEASEYIGRYRGCIPQASPRRKNYDSGYDDLFPKNNYTDSYDDYDDFTLAICCKDDMVNGW